MSTDTFRTTTNFDVRLCLEYTSFPEEMKSGALVHIVNTSKDVKLRDVDVVVMLDTSGSMEGKKLAVVKKTIHILSEQLTDSSTLTLISFDTDAKCIYNKNSTDSLKTVLSNIKASGNTNIEAGLQLSVKELNVYSKNVKVLIGFTDGEVNIGKTGTSLVNWFAKYWEENVPNSHIWLGALGNYSDSVLIQQLTSISIHGNFQHIPDNDYEGFPEEIGGVISSVQTSVSGIIHYGKNKVNFCIPYQGSFGTLFKVDICGLHDIIIMTECDTIPIVLPFNISRTTIEDAINGLGFIPFTLWTYKRVCSEWLQNWELVDEEILESMMSKTQEFKSCKDGNDEFVDALMLETEKVLKDVKKMSLLAPVKLELYRMASNGRKLSTQQDSKYTQGIAQLFRQKSQEEETEPKTPPVSPADLSLFPDVPDLDLLELTRTSFYIDSTQTMHTCSEK